MPYFLPKGRRSSCCCGESQDLLLSISLGSVQQNVGLLEVLDLSTLGCLLELHDFVDVFPGLVQPKESAQQAAELKGLICRGKGPWLCLPVGIDVDLV